jgi:hypothetical protein
MPYTDVNLPISTTPRLYNLAGLLIFSHHCLPKLCHFISVLAVRQQKVAPAAREEDSCAAWAESWLSLPCLENLHLSFDNASGCLEYLGSKRLDGSRKKSLVNMQLRHSLYSECFAQRSVYLRRKLFALSSCRKH